MIHWRSPEHRQQHPGPMPTISLLSPFLACPGLCYEHSCKGHSLLSFTGCSSYILGDSQGLGFLTCQWALGISQDTEELLRTPTAGIKDPEARGVTLTERVHIHRPQAEFISIGLRVRQWT